MIVQVDNPALEVHDLTVSYQKKPVLWGIDLTVPKGAIVGIIGPNGAGKSTFIKSIMDLIPISSGYIKLFDKPLDKVRHKVSYVPQRGSVEWDFPASVLDVVMMGRYGKIGLFKKPKKADKEIAMSCLIDVGMEDFANRQIAQLSGGQQQRVFIARALAQDADIYFMDEPFAGVDASTEKSIIELMNRLKDKGKTIIVVHHDLQTAAEYFSWCILLNLRLVASGPVKKVLTPALLQETFGGKLTMLAQVQHELDHQNIPNREG